MKSVVMEAHLVRALLEWSRTGSDREACGILLGRIETESVSVERVERVRNVARARDAFELDPGAIVALDRALHGTRLGIVGFWHSHADGDGAPSTQDVRGAWPGLLTAVVRAERSPAVRFWRFEAHAAVEVPAVAIETCRARSFEENLPWLERS